MRYAETDLIIKHCSREIQDALNKNIPMTYERFCECGDRLVEIGAYETALELFHDYPEYAERNLYELGLEEEDGFEKEAGPEKENGPDKGSGPEKVES